MKNVLYAFIALLINSNSSTAQWVQQNSGTTDFLTQVFFPSKDTGYVVSWGPAATIIKTTNGGFNWTIMPTTYSIVFIYFTSNNIGYGTTNDKKIVKTTDGGVSWNVQQSFTSYYELGAVYFSDSLTGYTTAFRTSDKDTLFFIKTTNAGLTWNLTYNVAGFFVRPPYSTCISFANRDTGLFVGLDGLNIFRTRNGCVSVDTAYQGGPFSSINFPTINVGYAGLYPDVLMKTINGGNSWNSVGIPSNNQAITAMDFTSKDTGYIVVTEGEFYPASIYKTSNGGSSWVFQTTDTTLYSLHFPTATRGYAAGEDGTILRYNGTVNINEESQESSVSIYPNPSKGTFYITMPDGLKETNISVYDMTGREVYSATIRNQQSEIRNSFSPGTYFVKVTTEAATAVKKLVIQ
jgi:hypothetical protein